MSARALAVLVALAASTAAGVPATVIAQQQSRPERGKIDAVEREARGQRDRDDRDESDEHDADDSRTLELFAHVVYDVFRAVARPLGHWFAPANQGYLDYPYAERRALERFVLHGVTEDRSFGAASVSYFHDAGSTLRAVHVTLDGALGAFGGSAEYSYYREPTASDTDELHLWRVGLGVLPRLGEAGYLRIGLAARGLVFDDGSGGGGPEFEIGAQLFPRYPVGVSWTSRWAGLMWKGGGGRTSSFAEHALGAGVFRGRLEVRLSYQWTQVGDAPWFEGPTLGAHVWF